MRLSPLLAGVLLCACSKTSYEPVATPSGGQGYMISCERPVGCYRQAGELCPRGYEVLDSGQHVEKNEFAQYWENENAANQRRAPLNKAEVMTSALIACR